MQKIQKHIEIVGSTKTELSSMSRESRDAVHTVLSKYYAKVGVTIVNDLSDLESLVKLSPDLVFLGMTFLPANSELGRNDPDKIWLAEYLDEFNISYTGSNQFAHELEGLKPLAKQRVLDFGLSTSPFEVIEQNKLATQESLDLKFPVFIKPANRGGGQGIDSQSVAHNFRQLQAKVRAITNKLGADSLIEEYLPGREFTVAILKDEHSDEFSVMPLELIAPADNHGARILTSKIKSADAESFFEVIDRSIRDKITTLAINVFHALGARDYGRIDIRLDEFGTPFFLEANLLPSLINGYGNFPKACLLNMGIGYETMLLRIVALGMKRTLDEVEELVSLSPIPVPA